MFQGILCLVLGVEIKWGYYVLRLFCKITLSLVTTMSSSRRDFLNCMAEHRSILKNNQNTYYSLTFQGRPMFSHINGKLSPRPFE